MLDAGTYTYKYPFVTLYVVPAGAFDNVILYDEVELVNLILLDTYWFPLKVISLLLTERLIVGALLSIFGAFLAAATILLIFFAVAELLLYTFFLNVDTEFYSERFTKNKITLKREATPQNCFKVKTNKKN